MHPFNGKPISAIKYNQECRKEEKAEINYIDCIKERNAESFWMVGVTWAIFWSPSFQLRFSWAAS